MYTMNEKGAWTTFPYRVKAVSEDGLTLIDTITTPGRMLVSVRKSKKAKFPTGAPGRPPVGTYKEVR